MANDSPRSLPQQFFRACMYLLGGVLAVWLALELLARLWGWILLLAAVALIVWAGIAGYRLWRDRRW